ncbi:MAG: VOC family protein [Actinomycetota bacterium]
MPELDHLIYAAPDLEAGMAHVESLTGVRPVIGGPHPNMGTHNALLTFDATTYFEVIAIDPDQPEPDRDRPFGLTAEASPRLAGYAIHPAPGETLDQVADAMRAAGFDPGPVRSMSRIKPDGEELHWRLTSSGAAGGNAEGALPFVIDWGDSPSPAVSLPSMGRLVELRVTHPDAGMRAVATALDLGLVVGEGPPSVAAVIETPGGRIELT